VLTFPDRLDTPPAGRVEVTVECAAVARPGS
jgi:hypothetical protein